MSKDTNFKGRYFCSSDTHLGHKNILQYCQNRGSTVEEMNELLIERWNSVVAPDDKVIHVGDIAMGLIVDAIPLIRRLNGKKILVRGNHDKTLCKMIFADHEQYGDLFETITFQYEMTHKVDGVKHQIVFSHYPYTHYSGQDRGVMHCHGHLHSVPDRRHIHEGKIMDVGADGNNLTPYLLDDVVRILRDRSNKTNHHEV